MPTASLEALAALAESLGESASAADLERALPLITRVLRHALSDDPLVDLGETEPAFGLQFRPIGEEGTDGAS